MRTRSLLALALAVSLLTQALARPGVCLAAPTPAAAPATVDEQAEFEKGRNAYRAQKFEEADARFFNMLDPEHGTLHDKVLIRQSRMYWAATQLALHRESEATGQFEIILTDDHDYEPDPLAFSTEVVNAFIDARARLHEKLEEAARDQYRRAAERRANAEAVRQREADHIKMLERLAREVLVTQKHERWVALLPFGVGQFQNGQRRAGWFFLVTESLFAATGIATLPLYYVDLADSHDAYYANNSVNAQQYLDRANAVRYVNLSAYGALALTAVVGVIHAEVTYEPDIISIEPRAVPALAPAAPPAIPPVSFGVAPVPGRDARGVGGGTLSVTVAF